MISSLVKKIMSACSLTQEQLAEVMGANLDRVKSLTSGRVKKLKPDETKAIVEKLHISGNWLATGEGEMFKPAAEQAFANDLAALRKATDLVTTLPLSGDRKLLVRDILFAVASGKVDQINSALDRVDPLVPSAGSGLWRELAAVVVDELGGAGIALPGEKFIDLVDLLHEHFAAAGGAVNRDLVRRHLRLVA